MLRVFLLIFTAAIVLLLVGPGHLADKVAGSHLVSGSGSGTTTSFLARPAIRVLSAPTTLGINEPGTVEVQAEAPAVPGTTVILRTAGAYGLGYNKVSSSTLDNDLRATLTVTGREYAGTFNYWAFIPASGTYQSGQSATFAITIAAPSAPARRRT